MYERMSRLHDGDLDLVATRELLRDVGGDVAARDRWTRYQLAGDVIRGNITPDDGFTLRILARLATVEQQPGYDPLAD